MSGKQGQATRSRRVVSTPQGREREGGCWRDSLGSARQRPHWSRDNSSMRRTVWAKARGKRETKNKVFGNKQREGIRHARHTLRASTSKNLHLQVKQSPIVHSTRYIAHNTGWCRRPASGRTAQFSGKPGRLRSAGWTSVGISKARFFGGLGGLAAVGMQWSRSGGGLAPSQYERHRCHGASHACATHACVYTYKYCIGLGPCAAVRLSLMPRDFFKPRRSTFSGRARVSDLP